MQLLPVVGGRGMLRVVAVVVCLATHVLVAAQSPRSPGHLRMLDLLEEIAAQTPETDQYVGDLGMREAREALAELPDGVSDANRWQALMRAADEELRMGYGEAAFTLHQQALEMVTRLDEDVIDARTLVTLFKAGVAALRWGETVNCAVNPSANSCRCRSSPMRFIVIRKARGGRSRCWPACWRRPHPTCRCISGRAGCSTSPT